MARPTSGKPAERSAHPHNVICAIQPHAPDELLRFALDTDGPVAAIRLAMKPIYPVVTWSTLTQRIEHYLL